MPLVMTLVLMSGLMLGQAQPARPADPWAAYRFLLGQWVGEGDVQGGSGSGMAAFKLDLSGRIIVRTNHAEYPATAQRPAIVHDDLLIIYRAAPGQMAKAIYFDNEDHTIEYEASVSADGTTVTFVSLAQASAPRYRLVYTKVDASSVRVKFEMASPGSPEAFKTYTEAPMKKVK